MITPHFNFQTMTSYRKNEARRGYNPFDYPEEWEFFKYPFEEDAEDDILTNLLFQISKMARRIHLYFDDSDYNRLETAFYFGLLDSLSETEDYILGALKYARYCRLENLFFFEAHNEFGDFLEKLIKSREELISKIRSFGEDIVELNKECHDGDLFLRQYCELTRHGIPDEMIRALLRMPDFMLGSDNIIKIDENTSFWSYFDNLRAGVMFAEEESNLEGACDSSKLETMLDPIDNLLWHIRGTLLWLVIKKILMVCSNFAALANRHNKLVNTMCQDAYKDVCGVYARSKAYAKRRDEELPRQCGEEMFLDGRKPTNAELHTYFNTQYRSYILANNQSQRLFHQYRKQQELFCFEFLKMLLDEEKREDAEEFLFFQTFGKELSAKQSTPDKKGTSDVIHENSAKPSTQVSVTKMKVETLTVDNLIIEGGGHPHFPECLSLEDSIKLYDTLSKEGFIDSKKTPLEDFNYLMGAATQYTTPNAPKPIRWLKNRQMLLDMLKLAFAPLLENGTTQSSLAKLVPKCFVDKDGSPLSLAKKDERQIVQQELNVLQNFFTTISRPNKTS